MGINNFSWKSAVLWGVVSAAFLLSGCNSSFSDPFAPRPVGQKFFVAPDADNQFPMTLHSETLVTRATLLKVSLKEDLANSRSGFASISAGQVASFKSVALLGKHGFKDVYDLDRIKKLNDTQECKAIEGDVKDIMMSYPGMVLVCGVDFTNEFRAATSVFVTTADGKEHEFSSWGSHFSEGAGYRVVIQSLTL